MGSQIAGGQGPEKRMRQQPASPGDGWEATLFILVGFFNGHSLAFNVRLLLHISPYLLV